MSVFAGVGDLSVCRPPEMSLDLPVAQLWCHMKVSFTLFLVFFCWIFQFSLMTFYWIFLKFCFSFEARGHISWASDPEGLSPGSSFSSSTFPGTRVTCVFVYIFHIFGFFPWLLNVGKLLLGSHLVFLSIVVAIGLGFHPITPEIHRLRTFSLHQDVHCLLYRNLHF